MTEEHCSLLCEDISPHYVGSQYTAWQYMSKWRKPAN